MTNQNRVLIEQLDETVAVIARTAKRAQLGRPDYPDAARALAAAWTDYRRLVATIRERMP